jgi:hypothetical protein
MRPADAAEMPRALRKRPKDRRGYPIPFIVLIDTAKRPHFTINNGDRVLAAGRKKLCGLCGGKLRGDIAFVGGPVCFLSSRGAFSDPPMHAECARYAIRVCPYLAAPSYGRRIDDKTLKPEATPGGVMIREDLEVAEDRPVAFMLGTTDRFEMFLRPDGAPLFQCAGRWSDVEVWQHGQRLEGEAMEAALAADKARSVYSG